VFNATDCTFNSNTGTAGTSSQGVGIQFFTTTAAGATNTVTLNRVTVNGNIGNNTGPGVGINGTATGGNLVVNVLNSTVSNNSSSSNGGGVAFSNTGATVAGGAHVINVTNSTISGNTANANGGGFYLEAPVATSTVTGNINFSTIANNRANNDSSGSEGGGGVFHAATGTLNMKNSIVADNTVGTGGVGPDVGGGIVSGDYNHIEDTTGATITGTTTNNATGDPQLGALANNGGNTQTHLPGAGSPVLNTIPNGTNDCGTSVITDQRGTTRPNGAGCEKGSVEVASIAAGPWDLGGRVLTSDGRGIRNVIVTVSGGGLPQPLVTQTGMLGWFFFPDLPGGVYTVTVSAKRFTFAQPSHQVTLGSDVTNEVFTADPGFGVRPVPDSKDIKVNDEEGS
jgi:parallel beta-helix repeat protein